jgi:hypothetical protein
MTARQALRIGFLLNRHGSLEAAGVVRGDIAEGARFLEALKDPLNRFLEEARREAARLRLVPPAVESARPPDPIDGDDATA